MGPNRVVLKNHPNVPSRRRDKPLTKHGTALDQYVAAVRSFQTCDASKRGGFAATAWPQKGDELTFIDPERDVIHCGNNAVLRPEMLDKILNLHKAHFLVPPARTPGYFQDAAPNPSCNDQ